MTVHQITRHALVGRLADPSLLRHQAYVDGQWVDADGGDTVGNPGSHGCHRPRPARVVWPVGELELRCPAP